MSGLAGILNLDGAPVDPDQLRKMADAMAYRGLDGHKVWHDGPIGLVHCHFWTTPEEVGEQQPICSPDGRHWITADARIDNRDELIPLLGAKGYLSKNTPTDAEVALAAYQCWGEECARHVVGDFAFAIWDAPARRLFLVRDVIGLRQLYYALVDGAVYFGTTISGVLAALPQAPSLNRRVIEGYLRGRYSLWVCQTVYEEILRLPPAHSLIAGESGLSSPRLYHVLGSQPSPDCRTDREWMEAFRAVLDEAVRSRLRSNTPVGILVSGGLDSSAIACVAHELAQSEADLPAIRLYSSVFPETPSVDESEFSEALTAHCAGFVSKPIASDGYWSLSELGNDDGFALDEPALSPLGSLLLALFRSSAADGCHVAVWGDGGDAVLGRNLYCEPAALRGIGWRDWPAEIGYFRRWTGLGWMELLLRAYLVPHVPERFLEKVRASRLKRVPQWPWLEGSEGDATSGDCSLDESVFCPSGLAPAAAAMCRQARRAYDIARQSELDILVASCGVEVRSPFWDRRLLEFLLHIPHHLRTWRGVDRVIARDSLRGTLPELLRSRLSKGHPDALAHRGLQQMEQGLIEGLLCDSRAEALGFLDAELLRDEFRAYWQSDTAHQEPFAGHYVGLWKSVYLEIWLRDRAEFGSSFCRGGNDG